MLSHRSTDVWSLEQIISVGVQMLVTHLEPSLVATQTALSEQGVLMKERRSGAHVDRSGSAGPPSQRDSPASQTGATHPPVDGSQTMSPAQGSVFQPVPSAVQTERAAVPGLPVHLTAPGSQPADSLLHVPLLGSHDDPVGHVFSNQPRPSARQISND